MPWVRALLRGQKVYARADERGALLVERGRVEIRYKPGDGRKYEARSDNLTIEPGSKVLPDETCGPAEAVAKDAGLKDASQTLGRAVAAPAATKAASSRRPAATPLRREADVPHGAVVAYADGACSGNPGPAGLGVLVLDGPRRVEISEYLGVGTNNIAELTAVLRALAAIDDPARPLVIRTDSQYAIGVLQKGWKAKANVDLIEELREALSHRRARLEYVRGHAGDPGNERADELAREAVQLRRTRKLELPAAAGGRGSAGDGG